MKKIMLILAIALFGVTGIVLAQTMQTKYHSINWNLDTNTVTVAISQGYYDNTNTWQSSGVSIDPIVITDPEYTVVLNQLEQENALNLNEVESTIQNSI